MFGFRVIRLDNVSILYVRVLNRILGSNTNFILLQECVCEFVSFASFVLLFVMLYRERGGGTLQQ